MKRLLLCALFSLPACSRGDAATPALPAVTVQAAAPVAAPATPADPAPIAVGTKLKCPVSGEDFTVDAKTTQVVYNSKRYAFCCDDCKPAFLKNPSKYAR